MMLHIFVATTQGLVKVQSINEIDDSDISSIVSINGTSTTASISSSYHNYVKKGVGIIHNDFGCCSYRINISERIDHGNSWQLGFYLAHAAHHQGILADGKVTKGDKVIIATGEINTDKRTVQAVHEVQTKLAQCKELVQNWLQNDVEVQFLVPKDNEQDAESAHFCEVVSIAELEQAIACLPSLAASKPKEKQVNATETNTQLSATQDVDENKQSSSKGLMYFIASLLALAAVAAYVNQQEQEPKPPFKKELVQQQAAKQKEQQQIAAKEQAKLQPKAELRLMVSTLPVNLSGQHQHCGDKARTQEKTLTSKQLGTYNKARLCQLMLTATFERAALLIESKTKAMHQLAVEHKLTSANIPVTEIDIAENLTNLGQQHLLILVKPSELAKVKELEQQIKQTKAPIIKQLAVEKWLDKLAVDAEVLSIKTQSF